MHPSEPDTWKSPAPEVDTVDRAAGDLRSRRGTHARLAFTHEVRGVSSSSIHEGLILALRGFGLRLDASQPGHAQLSEPVGEPNSDCRLSASLSSFNPHDGVLLLGLVKVLDAGAHSDQGSGYYLAARLQDIRKVIENRLRGLGAEIRSRSGDAGGFGARERCHLAEPRRAQRQPPTRNERSHRR